MASSTGDDQPRTAHQPIHPAIRDKLDPEYVAFHDAHLQYIVPSEAVPWDPASRLEPSPTTVLGAQRAVDVGRVEDRDLGDFQARIFYPPRPTAAAATAEDGEKMPVLIWFHGGGFVMGGLGSENPFLRHVCRHVGCAVVSVNYRHAPEHVYPAAIDDCVAGYRWVADSAASLGLDMDRAVLGGLSAGGCLAAITSMKVAQLGDDVDVPRPRKQVLICPVIDNTASDDDEAGRWWPLRHAPWLTPSRMRWYREKYFPTCTPSAGSSSSSSAAGNWNASPCFAPHEILAGSPPTWIAAAGCDLLAPEAVHYGDLLREAGVAETTTRVYEGATHSVLLLAGIHRVSRELVHDACREIAAGLGLGYDADTAVILGPEEP